ncbi:MAG: transglycosylase SLT domain-containing protein [Prevotella sp.]|nr:transglycosylase SLT domain-containing protein [Prevotella sp.]
MRTGAIVLFALLLLTACGHRKQEPQVTPWGTTVDSIPEVSDEFDLADIQRNGELIALTLTGPETYYEYHGRHLGAQYLLAQRFADRLGVSLRMEVCRDTAEMRQRLADGEADLVCYPVEKSGVGWLVGDGKDDLKRELLAWYKPAMLDEVKKEEDFLLSSRSVKRRVFSPMLDRAGGVISHYDGLFRQYAQTIRWDWRLMAAQCYQESTFDPQARSWAGACGLMQIMPATADHLGLARADIYDPEKNIAAAARLLGELERSFSDIPNPAERTKFVLAAYNGGGFHIRDAMRLAEKHGRNAQRWADVEPYVLGLANPEYYNDPVVRNGYMRGSETVGYVRKIHERWDAYRGVKTPRAAQSPSGVPQKATHERKKKYQI